MGHIVYERIDQRYTLHLRDGEIVVAGPTRDERGTGRAAATTPDELRASEHVALDRITLDVADPAIELQLDRVFPARILASGGVMVVRVSPVPPRVQALPLTLPIRIFELDDGPGPAPGPREPLSGAVARALAGSGVGGSVVEVHAGSSADLWSITLGRALPTIEVLHDRSFEVPGDAQLPDRLLRLGRFLHQAQTRLLVLESARNEEPAARVFAQRLVSRGGPAVLVLDRDAARGTALVQALYVELLHDRPLDWAVRAACLSSPTTPCALFAGAGREELLRISRVGLDLLRLASPAPDPAPDPDPDVSPRSGDFSRPSPSPGELAPDVPGLDELFFSGAPKAASGNRRAAVDRELGALARAWRRLRFERPGGKATVPLAGRLDRIRAAWPRPEQAAAADDAPRRLLCDFHDLDGARRGKQALLRADEAVLLGLQIASSPGDERHVLVPPIVEEQIKWSTDGAWLQLGVTGIDFDVLGDPVQDVFLPRTGPSEVVHFAVTPRRTAHAVPGFARLRYTLYQDNRVLQSFLLAARLAGDAPGATWRNAIEGYVRALSVSADMLVGHGIDALSFLTRLEYAEQPLDGAIEAHPRALSIVANDSDGTPVISLKTDRAFAVRVSGDLDDRVAEVRLALCVASSGNAATDPESTGPWFYRFDPDNTGSDALLGEVLPGLAAAGWALHDAVVPAASRRELAPLLGGTGETIQVAHVLLDKVIPWAAIYDQPYDSEVTQDDDGHAVEHATCLAALPDARGQMPALPCGQAPGCVLGAEESARRAAEGRPRLLPSTVACPRHFWGFRHRIELPAQQVAGVEGQARALVRTIDCERPIQVVVGAHTGLASAEDHAARLQALLETAQCTLAHGVAHLRDQVLAALRTVDLDIAYLYCHAWRQVKGVAGRKPHLEFGDGIIRPEHLAADPWSHHPLVFLNGCFTAGFRPDALSPFISRLVEDRAASGVIGTEITVFEPFAAELALLFLARFLAGQSAGDALLEARRILLARRNPLGLVYTLYAAADLRLRPPPG
jgi:hypothetical protein